MHRSVLVLGLILAVACLAQAGIKGTGIALEAELAQRIEEPMKIDDDAVGKGASNGKFIWMEGKPATGGGGEGWAEFDINLSQKGEYAIWGHVLAWDGNSDSFWVTWKPADPDEDAQKTQNTKFRWAVAGGDKWHWDRINAWLDGGTPERTWKIDQPGKTTLRISVREDATMLDALFITTNVKATDPADVNLRLPTAADRELQVKGSTAVDPGGKVTTTWAGLKQR